MTWPFGGKEKKSCEHCQKGLISYDELLKVVKQNFPNTYRSLVEAKKRKKHAS